MELYKTVTYKVKELIMEIDTGKIGLPELQRGYVWRTTKVRDLFDSMMKGFPIGYLMLWDSSYNEDRSKTIGLNNKTLITPKYLLIDGQQRMTSLYAAMYHKKIMDENFNEKYITISFNLFTREFKVANYSTKLSPEWIYDISEVFLNETKSFFYITEKVQTLSKSREKMGSLLSDDERQIIQQNITYLLSLTNYNIPTLIIDGNTSEENVANIFVRVNSSGVNLGEDDFILTLLSVYWQEGRNKIIEFCKSAKIPKGDAYNFLMFEPTPAHIVRVAMCYGFKRARLHYVYMLLRGKNFETEEYSDELRDEQLSKLKIVLEKVLNPQSWNDFLNCIEASGFVSNSLISSNNTLVFTYALYLIGKHDFLLKESDLRKLISKWFFMASLSGYYTGSTETKMESDLADLRKIKTADEFKTLLDNKISSVLTNDFFDITMDNSLKTSYPKPLAWLGYCASLCILDAKVLFSTLPIRELFRKRDYIKNRTLEKHHLFPKAYLSKLGITDDRDRNQIANFAFIEWKDNLEILDSSPAEYMKDQLSKIPIHEKPIIYEHHALPEGWENMEYYEFLKQRRILITKVIRKGFERL